MTALTAKVTEPSPPPPPGADAPKRRGVELTLLVGAVLISVLGHLYVGLATTGHLPGPAARYATGLSVAALLAHLAVRLRAPYADPLLLPIAVLLNGLGLVLIQRLDVTTPGHLTAGDQLLWSALGVALFVLVVVLLRDHRVLQRYAYLSVAVALVLMLIPVFFPAVNGAHIWIRFAGLSFQPGSSPRSCSRSSSPPTSPRTAPRSPSPAAGCSGSSGSSPAVSSARSSRSGCSASAYWSWSGTWAPRCCSSDSS